MGFFPYLAPLSPWTKQVMEQREANPQLSILQKNTFAIMTSAARVVKGSSDVFESDKEKRAEEILKIISGSTDPSTTYRGCIISNNINDLGLSYSLNGTPVGVDFDGKIIKVEGETGRRVSTPIIESIDIDTDGANNTLKTAKVQVRCFTLKQLEMFEMFFMKPGMFVLIEWGDASLRTLKNSKGISAPNEPVTNKKFQYNAYNQSGSLIEIGVYNDVTDALVPKRKYEDFCNNFYRYFRSDTTAQAEYGTRVERSLGTYDLVAGKVTDYTFSVDADGTYTVSLDVSQGNQISLAIPNSKPNSKGKTKTPPKDLEFSSEAQIRELIVSDFNLDADLFNKLLSKEKPEHGKNWEADWFNFLKINKEQGDTVASSTAYISLRFILQILANYIVADGGIDEEFFKLQIPTYEVKGKKDRVPLIPVTSHLYLMSSSEEIIFPRKDIPQVVAPKTGKKTKKGTKNAKKDDPVDAKNEEVLQQGGKIDGRIDGLDFHVYDKIVIEIDRIAEMDGNAFSQSVPELRIGNALNIFLKYETIVKYWKTSYTRIDFIEKVLGLINKNGHGLFSLIYGVLPERQNNPGRPGIFDYRFSPQEILEENVQETYRFKPTTIKSIVREFSFNFEMSNLVAGRTVFNSGKFLALAKEKAAKGTPLKDLPLPPEAYKSIDNSTFGNADGYYSVNEIEFRRITENFDKAKKDEEKKSTVANEDTKKEETTNEEEDLAKIIKDKSVNFLISENAKSKKVCLIYKDDNIIRKKINPEEVKKNRPSTAPITVTLTVDGFSGFRCGQYFNTDGVPEIYNKLGVFQITNTKHNVSKDGWTTTIDADYRIVNKKPNNK